MTDVQETGGNPEMPSAALRVKVVILWGEVICTGTDFHVRVC